MKHNEKAKVVVALAEALSRQLGTAGLEFTHDGTSFELVADESDAHGIDGTVWTLKDGGDFEVMTVRLTIGVTS